MWVIGVFPFAVLGGDLVIHWKKRTALRILGPIWVDRQHVLGVNHNLSAKGKNIFLET